MGREMSPGRALMLDFVGGEESCEGTPLSLNFLGTLLVMVSSPRGRGLSHDLVAEDEI